MKPEPATDTRDHSQAPGAALRTAGMTGPPTVGQAECGPPNMGFRAPLGADRVRRSSGPARMVLGAIILSLALTACGGSDSNRPGAVPDVARSSVAPSTSAPVTIPEMADAEHNSADVSFAQEMIVHHRGAVTMVDLTAARASNMQVKELSERIKAAQGPEIELMTSWLPIWGESTTTDKSMSDMNHSSGSGKGNAAGMMTGQQMRELKAATGKDFDRMFLELMIIHHRGALSMAKTEETDGSSPPAIALAKSIRITQTDEIAEMSRMLKDL
jgi:uncharacterized protein (DUF305 family)